VKGHLRGKRRPYTYRVALERVNVAVAVDARVQVRAGKVADESRIEREKNETPEPSEKKKGVHMVGP
jgi:hypothetical protein